MNSYWKVILTNLKARCCRMGDKNLSTPRYSHVSAWMGCAPWHTEKAMQTCLWEPVTILKTLQIFSFVIIHRISGFLTGLTRLYPLGSNDSQQKAFALIQQHGMVSNLTLWFPSKEHPLPLKQTPVDLSISYWNSMCHLRKHVSIMMWQVLIGIQILQNNGREINKST